MRQLRFRSISTGNISTPLPMRNRSYKPSESLTATLCTLFPHKAAYFMAYNQGRLIVTDAPVNPFGPSPSVLSDFFFDDIEKAAAQLQERYRDALVILELTNNQPARITGERTDATGGKIENALPLSIEEFHALHRAVIEGERVSALICSIFLDPDNLFSLFIPLGTPLKKLFAKAGPVAEHLKKNPKSRPYHPISGREFETEELTGFSTNLIAFSESGYVLSPGAGPLFGFPYWNRTLGMRRGIPIKKETQPCTNCLACSRFCPAGIFPSHLFHNITHDNRDEAEHLGLNRCIQCGICQFVCPSCLPLYTVIIGALTENSEGE